MQRKGCAVAAAMLELGALYNDYLEPAGPIKSLSHSETTLQCLVYVFTGMPPHCSSGYIFCPRQELLDDAISGKAVNAFNGTLDKT